jgi:hypothetical protein
MLRQLGVCGLKNEQQNAVVLPFDRRQTLAKSRRGPVVERFDMMFRFSVLNKSGNDKQGEHG